MNIGMPTTVWRSQSEKRLSNGALDSLFSGAIAFVRLSDFATAEECEQLVTAAIEEDFSPYRGVKPTINRIGNTVFEYKGMSKSSYFAKNRELSAVQKRIFAKSFNPLERFMKMLGENTGKNVKIAQNIEGESYYAGLIRRIENGTLLHVDFAPGEQPDWEVAEIKGQLVWNLYLRVSCRESGKTHIFNRRWEKSDAVNKEGIYGYNKKVVNGQQESVFSPEVGEIIIFNTRNFHYVEPTKGERVAFTSAIGQTHEDRLVLWS